jgi:hypothetical protein
MNNFNNMYQLIRQMQTPIITVTNTGHDHNYIVIPDGNNVTVFVFCGDCLSMVTSLNMSFQVAISHYANSVLDDPGAIFKLTSC